MIESAKKHLKVYWQYFIQFWKTRLIYKTDFALSSFTQMVNLGTSLAFLTLIFTQVENINGWSFNEMLLLAGLGGLVMNIHHVFMLNIYNLGEDYVLTGGLDRMKVRPLNILFQVYADQVRDQNVPKLLTNIALIVYASSKMQVQILSVQKLLYGAGFLVSGTLTFGAIYLFVASFSFWTGRSKPLIWILFRLSDFRRYPFSIYSTPIKALLVTLVPLAFASFFPATFFLGRDSWKLMQYISIIAGPIAYFIAYRFWRYGLSNYSSTGS